MEKRKKKRIIPYCVMIGILSIGVVLDIYVNVSDNYKIGVSESYMDYIYAGIISVSVLCFSFVALLSGFLDRMYYGYKLREILQFKESPVNFKSYIVTSLSTIVVATVFLATDFRYSTANGMTFLLIAIIWFEGNIAFKIYEIITDDSMCYNYVSEHISEKAKSEQEFETFRMEVDRIISAFKACIKDKDLESKDIISNMLEKLAEIVTKRVGKKDYYNYYNYFNDKFKDCITGCANNFGYNEMVRIVIKVYTALSDFQYDRVDLYRVPLVEMSYWNDQQLNEYYHFRQIYEMDLLDEYKNGLIKNEEIEKILICYFQNIIKNQVCSKIVKQTLINEYFERLLQFVWLSNNEKEDPNQMALLHVIKHYVLNNENEGERTEIFKKIVKELFYNHPTANEKYYDFLSIFHQIFYAYIFKETETLNEKFRADIEKTYAIQFSTPSIVNAQAARLIKISAEEILLSMGRRIEKDNDVGRNLEYFPPYMMAKSVVWTKEFDISYFFMLYLIFYDDVGYNSIYGRFFKWNEVEPSLRMTILDQLKSKFDLSTGLINAEFEEIYLKYGEVLGHSKKLSERQQRSVFEHIMEEHGKRTLENLDRDQRDNEEVHQQEVYEKIDGFMREDKVYGWNSNYDTDFYIKYQTSPRISKKNQNNSQNVARILQKSIIQAVNSYIKSNTKKLILSFDYDGIRKMKEFLTENYYTARNYSFTEDWALGEYRNEEDFIQLVTEQNKVAFVETPKIRTNMFFNSDEFEFNVKISKMDFIELTDQQCVDYLEAYSAYNGLYNVEGTLMAKEEAMKRVKQIYQIDRFVFKLMVSFKRNDITHIEFDRN